VRYFAIKFPAVLPLICWVLSGCHGSSPLVGTWRSWALIPDATKPQTKIVFKDDSTFEWTIGKLDPTAPVNVNSISTGTYKLDENGHTLSFVFKDIQYQIDGTDKAKMEAARALSEANKPYDLQVLNAYAVRPFYWGNDHNMFTIADQNSAYKRQ